MSYHYFRSSIYKYWSTENKISRHIKLNIVYDLKVVKNTNNNDFLISILMCVCVIVRMRVYLKVLCKINFSFFLVLKISVPKCFSSWVREVHVNELTAKYNLKLYLCTTCSLRWQFYRRLTMGSFVSLRYLSRRFSPFSKFFIGRYFRIFT